MEKANLGSEDIRNICIVAHIDHGKTTLVDNLLASNRVISKKSAGVRYLDSREDEQERGITIESSVATIFSEEERGVVNIIDSPGHADFSSQVSIASDLCDGCLVVIDVVEGVRVQTKSVLVQTQKQGLKPLLVLNKIDRLIKELKLETEDAFEYLEKTIESVNAFYAKIEGVEKTEFYCENHFCPEKGNVIFASSIDGWSFTLDSISIDLEKRLGGSIRRFLWGDYYFCPTEKKVFKRKEGEKRGLRKRVFSWFVLEAVWRIYNEANSPRTKMMAWLPISTNVFETVFKILPSATEGNKRLLKKIVKNDDGGFVGYIGRVDFFKESECVNMCLGQKSATGALIGICRVVSGQIAEGHKIKLISRETEELVVGRIFSLLGRDVVPIKSASAGSICGIYADGAVHAKVGIICMNTENIQSSKVIEKHRPLMTVVIEAKRLEDGPVLSEALKLLCTTDPSAEHEVGECGEDLLHVTGKMHLSKCLKDLSVWYGDLELDVSEPMVPFRETLMGGGVTWEEVSRDGIEIHGGIFPLSGEDTGEIKINGDAYAVLSCFQENRLYIKKTVLSISSRNVIGCLVASFRETVRGGVLCLQPVYGVGFLVKEISKEGLELLSGRDIGLFKIFFKKAMEKHIPRLLFAFYSCELQIPRAFAGRVYSLLEKKKAIIDREEYNSYHDSITIYCRTIVAESLDMQAELWQQCRGNIFMSLSFAGFGLTDSLSLEQKYISILRKKRGMIVL
eukprot:GHVN01091665.1.p1 GENE.GHVN01091665.1~~GHVN01091665.1.p1  ORF type:complete len:737 (+),score=48.60 GHVN01091665.1:54-2264(+)